MRLRNNIFVSSTFRDMHAERDMLHRVVVPELAARFSKKHISVDLIDLRWGIDTSEDGSEEENTAKILRVCFDEIERSRPFFIGFIGGRYGWIPNATDVESAILGYSFNRGGRDMSITEMEMLYALSSFDLPESCLFFIREGISPEDIDDPDTREIYFPEDGRMREECDRLKSYLKSAYPDSTFVYTARWDKETGSVSGLEGLCETVIEALSALIEREIKEREDDDAPLGEEIALQRSLISDISEGSFGREREIRELSAFALGEEPTAELIISAPSGVGKSSLIARLCESCRESALVIPFLAGVSERSSDFRFLARYMLSVLTGELDDEILTLPYGEVKKRILSALSDAAAERRVILVVDALDQFAPSGELSSLDWIDEQILPKNVKIIYSALPDHTAAAEKRGAVLYELSELDPCDVRTIAAGIAARLHKELSPHILDLIADKRTASGERACGSAIYLVLLLELLSSFDSDDFAEIQRTENAEGLSPATAIQRYLERTIRDTGAEVVEVLEAISAKSIRTLGEKYGIITTLLTSSPEGISEADITGISALTDTPVSVADFSLYRRMLRIHLVEREGGKWVFNHAIIRGALTGSRLGRDNTALLSAAAEYYLSLPDGVAGKYAGAVRFLGMLGRYAEVAEAALSGGEESARELTELLISEGAGEILSAAGEHIFELLPPVYKRLLLSVDIDTSAAVSLSLLAVKAMLAQSWRSAERAAVLSDYYYLLGTLLLGARDKRAADFLEISVEILTRVCPNDKKTAERALAVSALFSVGEERSSAERYAYIAYRQAIGGSCDSSLRSRAAYTLTECIKDNPLTLRGALRGKYITEASRLAQECGDTDLSVKCALEYLRLPRLARKGRHSEEAIGAVNAANPDLLTPATFVARELYLAGQGNSLHHSRRAYDAAVMALAESADKDTVLLYARTAEEHLYRIMAEDGSDLAEAEEVMKRADGAMKKLALITADATFTDRRLAISEDFRHYLAARGRTPDGSVRAEIDREIDGEIGRRGGAVRKKDVYKSLGVKLGAIGFLAYAAVQFADFGFSTNEIGLSRQLSLLLRNFSESFLNILVAVMLFFGLLMTYSYEKRSYDYRTDNRSLLILGLISGVLLSVAAVADLIHVSLFATPYQFEAYFHGTTNALIYSVIFSASITWFIAYAFNLAVNRPYGESTVGRFRYKYRRRELFLRHARLIATAAIPALVFLPLFVFTPRYGADYTIDMFGTTPNIYKHYCYIPLILQALLSAAELIAAHIRYAPAVSRGGRPERSIRAAACRCAVLLLAAILTAASCTIARAPLRERLRGEYGYSAEGDFSYYVEGGEARLRRYHGTEDEVVVPDTLGGYPVTSAADGVFREAEVVSVTLPEGLTNLSYYMFRDCKALARVILPDSLTSISNYAFEGCPSLAEVSFEGTGYVEISSYAFEGGAPLFESEEVRKRGFLTLGNNIAWVDKANISGAVHIPEGVSVIENSAFSNASKITEVHLPDSLELIRESAFAYCPSIYYVRLPERLAEIGRSAFYKCTMLRYIDNYSALELVPGSEDHGGVAAYAKVISDCGEALSQKVAAMPSPDGGTGYRLMWGHGPSCLGLPRERKTYYA